MNSIILKIIDEVQYKLSKAHQNIDVVDYIKNNSNKSLSMFSDSIFKSTDAIENNLSFKKENFYIFPFFYIHEESSLDQSVWIEKSQEFIETNYFVLKNKNTSFCICDLFEASKNLIIRAEFLQKKYPDISIWIITADKKIRSKNVKVIYNDTWLKAFKPNKEIIEYQPEKLYINLTRVARYHRCLLLDNLIDNKLLEIGYNSWGDVYDSFSHYKNQNPNTKIEHVKFDVLDIDDLSKVNPNRSVPLEYCKKSFLYLNTETLVDNTHLFFSEKTYKPIGIGMPFITLGNPGTLEDLRSTGFFTFSEWFDERYDLDLPIKNRIQIIIDNLTKYSKYSNSSLISIRNEMSEILDYNLKLYTLLKQKNFLKENLRLATKEII